LEDILEQTRRGGTSAEDIERLMQQPVAGALQGGAQRALPLRVRQEVQEVLRWV